MKPQAAAQRAQSAKAGHLEPWDRKVATMNNVLRKAFASTAVAAALVFAGSALAQQPASKTLKMQSTWPASLTLQDNFKFFAERVDKLTGGTLKIETLAAGQIVPPFEILDATSKKVIDGGHGISYYWVGKNKAATLFSSTPAGIVGMDHMDFMGWIYEGGGLELWQDLYQKELKLNVMAFPILPASPQALGWFKKPITSIEDFKGLKCRQTGIVAEIYKRMGMNTVNMPGGEIVPSAERGVIDCAEWVGGIEDLRLGLPQVWKYHYTPGPHEMSSIGELIINTEVWAALTPAAARGDPVGDHRDLPALVGEVAEAECRRHRGDADQARHADPAHAARDPDRVLQGLGRDRQGGDGGEPLLQEGLRVAEGLCRQGGAGQAVHVPALLVCGATTTSRRPQGKRRQS